MRDQEVDRSQEQGGRSLQVATVSGSLETDNASAYSEERTTNNNTSIGRTSLFHTTPRFSVSEKAAKQWAFFACLGGVLGIAAGGGLILCYLIAEYTHFFETFSNTEALSIPGFVLIFSGILFVMIGIYFCWLRKPDTRYSRRSTYERDEVEAGFNLSAIPPSYGYCNPSMVTDLPPSYNTVLRCSTSTVDANIPEESLQKPPSYLDVAKMKENQSKTDVDERPPSISQHQTHSQPPPPYMHDNSSVSGC